MRRGRAQPWPSTACQTTHNAVPESCKTKKNKQQKKKEQNTPSKAEQLQCAFRFAARPGLQAVASAADPSRIRCSDVMMI